MQNTDNTSEGITTHNIQPAVNGAEKGTSVAEQKVASRLLKMDS